MPFNAPPLKHTSRVRNERSRMSKVPRSFSQHFIGLLGHFGTLPHLHNIVVQNHAGMVYKHCSNVHKISTRCCGILHVVSFSFFFLLLLVLVKCPGRSLQCDLSPPGCPSLSKIKLIASLFSECKNGYRLSILSLPVYTFSLFHLAL